MRINRNQLRSILREVYGKVLREEIDGPSLDLSSMAKTLELTAGRIETASSYMLNGEVDVEEGCREIGSQVQGLYDIIDNLRSMAA